MKTSALKRTPSLKTQVLLAALLLTGLVITQQTLTLDGTNRLNVALNNSAHAPWFFIVTSLLWYCSALAPNWDISRRIKWVVISAIVLSFSLEALQIFSRRDADLGDIGRNLLGAGSALCVFLGLHWARQGNPVRAIAAGLAAALLMLGNFIGVAEVLIINAQRNAIAPQLVSFNAPDYALARMLRGYWDLVPDQDSEISGFEPHTVARIDLARSDRWPGIMLREPLPDWSSYQWLIIEAYTDSAQQLELEVRVETFTERGIDTTVTIPVSQDTRPIRIPLLEFTGINNGKLDNVKNLYLFTAQPATAEYFYLNSVRLE